MLRNIERSVSMLAEYIGKALIVIMTLVVCFTVFTRYVLNYTPSWSEETALLCMVWFGFLSIALGVRDDGHIGVTIFDKLVSPRVLHKLDLFKWLCVCIFGVFMLTQGITLTKIGMHNEFPGLGITSAWLYVIVPIAGTAIIIYCIEKLIDLFRSPKADSGEQGEH